ncbi:hypothetical protein [Chitinilyticum piscinae]|uniref:Fimbrial assembly protein n=1 Tax=Chitinilyticum piscinae TaxID=2866724 RepID=A0A8J7G1S7_9NEIS|nr:hypothetical protein [Chitinilyticum piscinae]MBE9610400.1 hypothetical protein [Chitinilyticum piscinae]
MKPLYLDFHRSRQVVPWLGLLLIAAGVVALLSVMTQLDVVAQQRIQLQQDEDNIALQLRRTQTQQQNQQASSPQNMKQVELRTAQLYSPRPLLDDLGAHWASDVAFLRLDLDSTARNAKLELEARDLNQLLLFIDRLEATPGIDLVTLARSGAKPNDPFRPVQASLEVNWRKASEFANTHNPFASAASAASKASAASLALRATPAAGSKPAQGSSARGGR